MQEKFLIEGRDMESHFESASNQKPEKEEYESLVRYRLSSSDFEIAKTSHLKDKEQFLASVREHAVSITPQQQVLKEFSWRYIAEFAQVYSNTQDLERHSRQLKVFFLPAAEYKKYSADAHPNKSRPDTLDIFWPAQYSVLMWYRADDPKVYDFFHDADPAWDRDYKNISFLYTLNHELYHAQSFLSLMAFENQPGKPTVEGRRSGINMFQLRASRKFLFSEINEAITDELAIETTNRIINEQR